MEDKSWEKKYPPEDFKKTIYSFNASELAKIAPWDATAQVGEIAKKVAASILRGECFKRVGAKDSVDTAVEYNMQTGVFVVYEPKFFCSLCKNRKADYSSNGKYYCPSCVEILKQQAKEQEAKKESPVKQEKKEK